MGSFQNQFDSTIDIFINQRTFFLEAASEQGAGEKVEEEKVEADEAENPQQEVRNERIWESVSLVVRNQAKSNGYNANEKVSNSI